MARLRSRRQSRRRSALLILLLATALVGYDLTRPPDPISAAAGSPPAARATGSPAPSSSASGPAATGGSTTIAVVQAGAGTLTYAGGQSTVAGKAGPVLRYRVAVEDGVNVSGASFAAAVDTILGDPQSWTAGGTLRFQRVSGSAGYDFTVLLASPATSETMCQTDGLQTDQFTNCRLGDGRVVINSARWLTAVPDYGAPLTVYQAYAVNHEVGHQLGHGHELCPGAGQPAPVMQQQTYGLNGCVANSWPYLNGARYTGPATSS